MSDFCAWYISWRSSSWLSLTAVQALSGLFDTGLVLAGQHEGPAVLQGVFAAQPDPSSAEVKRHGRTSASSCSSRIDTGQTDAPPKPSRQTLAVAACRDAVCGGANCCVGGGHRIAGRAGAICHTRESCAHITLSLHVYVQCQPYDPATCEGSAALRALHARTSIIMSSLPTA